jgi:hypothetical protein
VITQAERTFIWEHAYVPEHVPEYVSAISPSEPSLLGDFLLYDAHDRLILVGYPLKGPSSERKLHKVFERTLSLYKSVPVSVTAPFVPPKIVNALQGVSDYYYRLELDSLSVSLKLRNSLKRADRDMQVVKTKAVTSEHASLIEQFVSTHEIDEATRYIFSRIPDYVAQCDSAWVLEGRNAKGELVVFDIAEYGSRDYAFYLFNFRSRDAHVPGSSDLLLSHIIRDAKSERKKYVNLGLGISHGVTFFKRKWGAVPFLPHTTYLYSPEEKSAIRTLLERL